MNTKKRVEKLESVLGKDTAKIVKIILLHWREDVTGPDEKFYRVGKTRWTEIKQDTEKENARRLCNDD